MNWIERRRRAARRRRLLGAGLALIVVLAGWGLLGFLLPAELVVSGQILLRQPRETVWHVLTDFDGMPLWRSDLASLERLPDLSGRPVWRELGRGEARVVELSVADPPTRLEFRRADGGLPALPARSFHLESTERGTRLTLSERSVLSNPLRRVLARLAPPRGTVNRFLRDLEQRLRGVRKQVATAPE